MKDKWISVEDNEPLVGVAVLATDGENIFPAMRQLSGLWQVLDHRQDDTGWFVRVTYWQHIELPSNKKSPEAILDS